MGLGAAIDIEARHREMATTQVVCEGNAICSNRAPFKTICGFPSTPQLSSIRHEFPESGKLHKETKIKK